MYFNFVIHLRRGSTCHVGTLIELSPHHRFYHYYGYLLRCPLITGFTVTYGYLLRCPLITGFTVTMVTYWGVPSSQVSLLLVSYSLRCPLITGFTVTMVTYWGVPSSQVLPLLWVTHWGVPSSQVLPLLWLLIEVSPHHRFHCISYLGECELLEQWVTNKQHFQVPPLWPGK